MYDVLVIGAGVIGTSIARELSKYSLSICVLEKDSDVAMGTSKANSAIVHAGFDAAPGTIKGNLNAPGNVMFDKLSKELDFPFKRIGSLVLCFNPDDLGKLELLYRQGIENGVPELRIIDRQELISMEPNVSAEACAALYAPTAGITCPYEMTFALAENAAENGVSFFTDQKVTSIVRKDDFYEISTERDLFKSQIVINAAGVYSDEMNNMVSNDKFHIIPRRGEYVVLDKAYGNLVSKTIFQLPTSLGKGVLISPTVDGNILIGPNAVDTINKEDKRTTSEGIEEIIKKAEKSVPLIPIRGVITSFTGLRARSHRDDFIIGEAVDSESFINAASIESPGLSSAPAIACVIADIVIKKLQPKLNKNFNPIRKRKVRFREMTDSDRDELIKKDPSYGRVICRCETVTEGEIIDAIHRTPGAATLDGVKFRTRAGMGRCQSGFCSSRVLEILQRELGLKKTEITKSGNCSNILLCKNKDDIKG